MPVKAPVEALEEAALRKKHEEQNKPLQVVPVARMDPVAALEQVRSGRPGATSPGAVLSLQQAAGNQAVQRLLGENVVQRNGAGTGTGQALAEAELPKGGGVSGSKAPDEAKKNFLAQLKKANQELYKSIPGAVFVPLEAVREKGFTMFNQSGRIAFMKDTGGWGEALADYESLYTGKYAKKKDGAVKIYTAEGIEGFLTITLRNVSSQKGEGVTGTIEFRVDGIGGPAEFVEFKYKG